MAKRAKTCFTCATYDKESRQCKLGKTNPRRKLDAIDVARVLGPQMLCLHNQYREPLLLRMHFPDRRFIWTDPPASRAGDDLEIEIVED